MSDVSDDGVRLLRGATARASVVVRRPPDEVWRAFSDVTRIPEWSPECVRAQWLDGATGPAVGARFRGWNRRGVARWATTCRIDAASPGEVFAFTMHAPMLGPTTRWTWNVEPGPDAGTSVVAESYEMLHDLPGIAAVAERFLMGVPDRGADLLVNLRTSLDRFKAAIER